MTTRQLHLNAFLMTVGHHESAWRFPETDPLAAWSLQHYAHLARVAESGRFDSIFFGDGPALQGDVHYGLSRPTNSFSARRAGARASAG